MLFRLVSGTFPYVHRSNTVPLDLKSMHYKIIFLPHEIRPPIYRCNTCCFAQELLPKVKDLIVAAAKCVKTFRFYFASVDPSMKP